jgi:hypothetical protein
VHGLDVGQGVVERLALDEDDELAAMERVSALRRLAASSKEVRVRVLGSWNQLTTKRP